MKTSKITKRILKGFSFLLICLLASQSASAKFSKASTNYNYEGVSVLVIDRSQQIGKSLSDTYGYTEFRNDNDYKVRINWRAYGVLKDNNKLEKVDSGTITVGPGKTHKEVYSYTNNRYTNRDFKKYVVAIEIADMEQNQNGSTKFTTAGVDVEVVDRHAQIGRSHTDTYGYLILENRNKYKVKIEWTAYGILKNDKRIKVDSGTTILTAGQTRKEVYSYGSNGFSAEDFKSYTAQIKVTRMDQEVGVNNSNESSIYKRIMSHKSNGSLDQSDYADAIAWMNFIFDEKLLVIYQQSMELMKRGSDKAMDRIYEQNKDLLERWSKMGDLIDTAYNNGKLNSANEKAFEALKYKVEQYAE